MASRSNSTIEPSADTQIRKEPTQASQKKNLNDKLAELEQKVNLMEAVVNRLMSSNGTSCEYELSMKTSIARATPQSMSSQHNRTWGTEGNHGLYNANIGQTDSIIGDQNWFQGSHQWEASFSEL